MAPNERRRHAKFHRSVQEAREALRKALVENSHPRDVSYKILQTNVPILEHLGELSMPCPGNTGNKFIENGKEGLECATCFTRGVHQDFDAKLDTTRPPTRSKRN